MQTSIALLLPMFTAFAAIAHAGSFVQACDSQLSRSLRSPTVVAQAPATNSKLTVTSLAGTYQGILDEPKLTQLLQDQNKRQGNKATPQQLKQLEEFFKTSLREVGPPIWTIKPDGTSEFQFGDNKAGGKVALDGNKLTFVVSSTGEKPNLAAQSFSAIVTPDGKELVVDTGSGDRPQMPLRYVKQ